jgi:hypothetical protein
MLPTNGCADLNLLQMANVDNLKARLIACGFELIDF